jgi:hypothetical protein
MARRGIVEPRGSQEPDNWTNRGIDKKMNTKERQKLFIIALKASGGNISKACDLCQCSRQTYYNWLENEESNFADIIAELQFETVERRIDLAEEKLDARLNLGSGPDIRFVLKTLGAKRGYGAKSTVTVEPGAGFKGMEWPDETPDLETWEATRDKEMHDQGANAIETHSQEGTHGTYEEAPASDSEGG